MCVSLLILISYRNPFLVSAHRPGPVNDCQTRVAERKKKMRGNKDGRGKRKRGRAKDGGREGGRAKGGDEERGSREAASTLFHAHHPFYILISPLSRRPFKAFCPLAFSLPLPPLLRVSLSLLSFPSSTRWHPFNIIMFSLPCLASFSPARASVSLFLTVWPRRPFVMV